MYYDGAWGSVCDDGWTDLNAETVCRILGYQDATANSIGNYHSNTDYQLLYISCNGNEANLLNCSHELYSDYFTGYCSSYEHVYIACGTSEFWIKYI